MTNNPTIAAVLEQFLDDQEQRLSARTFAQYQDVVELLQHYLDGYASASLDPSEEQYFERARLAAGNADLSFCDVFGPEHIPDHVGMFLNYFMIRKVMASRSLSRAAGTVTKRLAGWLAEQGYVSAEAAELVAERGAAAARKLPEGRDVAERLEAFTETQIPRTALDEIEDHFQITRVEPGRIWVRGLIDGRDCGPIQLPEEISRRCKLGWSISGVIGRVGKRWQLVDIWNVYPH